MNTKNSSWLEGAGSVGPVGGMGCMGPSTARRSSFRLRSELWRTSRFQKVTADRLLAASCGVAFRRIATNIGKAAAGLDLGWCHLAKEWRLGGEKDSFKGPDQPLADAYRRLPPVAAAYFSMCFFCEKGAVHCGRVPPRYAGVVADGHPGERATERRMGG
jgi:hypothetical protein